MQVTINPKTQKLKETVRTHGADGWVVMGNFPKDGQKGSLVCKDNKMIFLPLEEIK